jgi:dihydropteroate synthase
MTGGIYVRPAGRLMAAAGDASSLSVIRIGGSDAVVFTAAEILQRRQGAQTARRIVSVADLSTLARGDDAEGAGIRAALAGFSRARGPTAGLTMDRPRIMGIVNVTPDSFSDGGSFASTRGAIDHGRRLADEGADILDIGGESTRPGSDPVPLDEELRRVLPVLEGLAGRVAARLSVDTRKAEVMRRATGSGAHMLNDVSALTYDPDSLAVAAESGLAVVLMHAQGDPKTMQKDPRYDDVLLDVHDMLAGRIAACVAAGIALDRIVVDPGIGFGKTLAHNLELTAGLALLHGLGVPLMVGASRKSFIGRLMGGAVVGDRLPGSLAAALAAIEQGAAILRVHDVAATRQALTVWEAVTRAVLPHELAT